MLSGCQGHMAGRGRVCICHCCSDCMFLPYEAALSSQNETCLLVPGFSEHASSSPPPYPIQVGTSCSAIPPLYPPPPSVVCSLHFLGCIYDFSFMDSCNILSSMNRSILSSMKAGGAVRHHCLAWHGTWWIHKKYFLNGRTNFCLLCTTQDRK